MPSIVIGGIPSRGNNRSSSSVRKWHAAQTTNVSAEASSPVTSYDRLVEIVLNAKASDVSRVAANPASPADVLRLVHTERSTLETAKRLASNPATPDDLLSVLINNHPVGVVADRARRNRTARRTRKGPS